MAKVSAFKNKEVKQKLRNIFIENTEEMQHYNIVYGYTMKRSLFRKQVSNYIIAYDNNDDKQIVVIHICFNGELIEQPLIFTKDKINSISIKGTKLVLDATNLLNPITITIPDAIGTKMEMALLYPINQVEGLQAFTDYIGEKF